MTEATEKREPKRHKRRKAYQKIPYHERIRVHTWLALTENVTETSRMTGQTLTVVRDIFEADYDDIIMRRGEMAMELRYQFDATIALTQELGRYILWRIYKHEEPETALSKVAPSLVQLGRFLDIQTDKRQVLSNLPSDIKRLEARGDDDEKQREADRRYLQGLLQELEDKHNLIDEIPKRPALPKPAGQPASQPAHRLDDDAISRACDSN